MLTIWFALPTVMNGKLPLGHVIVMTLKSLEWDNKTTLVLSNTRELNRELFYKLVYLI